MQCKRKKKRKRSLFGVTLAVNLETYTTINRIRAIPHSLGLARFTLLPKNVALVLFFLVGDVELSLVFHAKFGVNIKWERRRNKIDLMRKVQEAYVL